MKKLIYFFVSTIFIMSFSACFSPNGELTGRKTTRLDYTIADPLGMQPIPGGSFTMGANDQDVPYASSSDMRTVTISPFWIDATEITNNEYRQFAHWVRDSIIRRALIDNGGEEKWGYINEPDPNWNQEILNSAYDERRAYINWSRNLNFQSKEVSEALTESELFLTDDAQMKETDEYGYEIRPLFQTKLIDTRKLIYEYTWFNPNAASPKSQRYEEVDRATEFVTKERVAIYPDTLAWVHDFTYNFNEPMFDKYFWHPAYGEYPVVGVSWKQAKAFCHWRTAWKLYWLPEERRAFETEYRLPTEAEWEWAARGGRELAMFPWGGPYSRNVKGCFLANFKPLRGNYWADGYIYTAPADNYPANDYFLYNMAGNVAEWTESAYNPMSDIFASDLNPEYTYNADNNDHPRLKRKVVKGGSWKDIGAFLQIGARDYEYQDSSRCYIGFRCVKSRPYQEGGNQFEEIFQGVQDKKQKRKNKQRNK
tara:strand:- start:609 stop:2051 length:1443 start_codon:yes stop_codon:yes gene_type:complete